MSERSAAAVPKAARRTGEAVVRRMSGREEPSASEAPQLAGGSWRDASAPHRDGAGASASKDTA